MCVRAQWTCVWVRKAERIGPGLRLFKVKSFSSASDTCILLLHHQGVLKRHWPSDHIHHPRLSASPRLRWVLKSQNLFPFSPPSLKHRTRHNKERHAKGEERSGRKESVCPPWKKKWKKRGQPLCSCVWSANKCCAPFENLISVSHLKAGDSFRTRLLLPDFLTLSEPPTVAHVCVYSCASVF